MHKLIQSFDKEIYNAIQLEHQRQLDKLELIASENIVSPRVFETIGNVMTNKYAEGYPEKRYYGGCEYVDQAENLAIQRACEIFKVDHANVQPHSGSQANMGVYFSVLKPYDTVLGMDLSHGGHLTHGAPVNFSGLMYNIVSYKTNASDQRIDYDNVRDIAKKSKPKLIIAGASAYPRVIDFKKFREIADEVGAYLLVDMAHIAGLVATGDHPSPSEHAHFITTTTHKTLRGARGGMILCNQENAKLINSRIFPGIQGGPFCNIIAAKAVAFKEVQTKGFKEYIKQVVKNAKVLADTLISLDYTLTTNGTDNHLMLIDLTNRAVTGKEATEALDKANITVNKNSVPFDKTSPFVTSGIRLGTPALTSRGLKEDDMKQVAEFIDQVIQNIHDDVANRKIAQKVKEFSNSFPEFHDTIEQ